MQIPRACYEFVDLSLAAGFVMGIARSAVLFFCVESLEQIILDVLLGTCKNTRHHLQVHPPARLVPT